MGGTFLSTPIRDKHSVEDKCGNMRYAAVGMQGKNLSIQ